ncbi:MAG: serine O-acetyltransferase [Syntrophobacteraceae bacterium]
MIQSYNDYLAYLEADRIALGISSTLKNRLFDEVWKFQRVLRTLEYLINCKKSRIRILINKLRFRSMSTRLGFTIGFNCTGPGLAIAHVGPIIIGKVKIGKNCRLHTCIQIGAWEDGYPEIGDDCYIGAGAKVIGGVKLGDKTMVAPNAVVRKSFPDGCCLIGGVPAKFIKSNNFSWLEKRSRRSAV